MELWEAIRGRRSTRKFKPDAISKVELERLLEAARWAPSWANTQVWEFIMVFDQTTKEKLADCLGSTNPGRPAMTEAPVVIAALGKKKVAGFKKGEPRTVLGDWLAFDVGMGVQNLCLAAWELGLGSVIVGSYDIDKASKLLNIPEDRQLLVLIPIGRPYEIPSPPKRKEIAEFTYKDSFGNFWIGKED